MEIIAHNRRNLEAALDVTGVILVPKIFSLAKKHQGWSKSSIRMSLSGGSLSSGTSSGWSQGAHSYGSEADMELQARMELKRKRRMDSNRESAKRSRQRKQQHLDDLTSQVCIVEGYIQFVVFLSHFNLRL